MIVGESRSQYNSANAQMRGALDQLARIALHEIDSHPRELPMSVLGGVPGAVLFADIPGSTDAQFAIALIDGDGQPRTVHGDVLALTEAGTQRPVIDCVSYREPAGEMPAMNRTRQSRYFYALQVEGRDDLSAIHFEYNVAPIVTWLESKGRGDIFLVGLATLVTMAATYVLLVWLMAPLRQLARLSRGMDSALNSGKPMHWLPETGVAEYDVLSEALDTAAQGLARNLEERSALAASLEKRVRQPTMQLDFLNQVVRQTRNAVLITDVAGRVTWANEAFIQMSGYGLDELESKKPGDLLQRTPPSPEMRQAMRAGLASGEGFDVEIVNHSRDGRAYWVEIRCRPLHDAQGRHTGSMAIQNDVTERQNLEDRLRQSQKLEAVGQITGGLAHDFKIFFRSSWVAPNCSAKRSRIGPNCAGSRTWRWVPPNAGPT
jgi:PAS domain S-box-containing protein